MIYSDRTRYIAGHECPWKRFLGFHAFGQGLSRKLQVAPLATGIAIHSALERILRAWQKPQEHSNSPKFDYPAIIGPAVDTFRETITERGLENYDTEEAHHQVALAECLPLAYARVCEEWMRDGFDILHVEEEMPYVVNESLTWMTRSDFITYDKTLATYCANDFKSASAWYPDNENQWRDNLQQMVNGYVAGKVMGVPVTHYYIHVLVKGTKRSPSPLVKPWYQPANPPMQIEDFGFKYKYQDANSGRNRYLSKSYERTPIHHITDDMGKWIFDTVPYNAVQDSIVVIGPFGIDNAKVEKFLRGLTLHEYDWEHKMQLLEDRHSLIDATHWEAAWPHEKFQHDLDRTFPRTYDCFKFGGQQCQFYNLCHNKPGWDNPLGNGEYEPRIPHHSTEEV